ncbi:MAG: hydantoinase/oxoprolinase family protein [Kordiimonadaceae bacterium]|nr:hydantoinase/oxoprolinase family protein [Kordiimonadaceae bacterium]
MLINIDNGGTLTDVCAITDDNFYKTKTLTTPYDLSKCFFDGLRAISEAVYGTESVSRLLAEVEHIRYSTTQGTNAIVERKGPQLGLILNKGHGDLAAKMRAHDPELFDVLVADRIVEIDLDELMDGENGAEAATAITRLTSSGANRVIICFDVDDAAGFETTFKQIAFENYPRHLLGAVPMLFASELVDDVSADRRAWTALINSFLHPAMESFLYNAENRLREYRTRNPLLIFRNDGNASRVAKTIAAKTYSSGPRGGMEGVKVFSSSYNLTNVLSMDVGGTTTDIGHVVGTDVHEMRRGEVEGIPISFALCEIISIGAGGSSILSVDTGKVQVGPESVGAVPGPACFGRGGKQATITDVNLLMGLLDPSTYFGGSLTLDVERARTAITENIASVLDVSVEDGLLVLRDAYEQKIANSLSEFSGIDDETVLVAFGGAGPMNACGAAEKAGINTVMVPKMAAVFSAFGIGSCDIGQNYSKVLADSEQSTLTAAYDALLKRAERDMFAEGFAEGDYEIKAQLIDEDAPEEVAYHLNGSAEVPAALASANTLTLEVSARKRLKTEDGIQAKIEKNSLASSTKVRSIVEKNDGWKDVPVYEVEEMNPGDYGVGPAVIEEEFFTCLVRDGWEFIVTELGDICLTKGDKK